MPQALLLSPDDQAVSAITAVLEEMSVTCERPLDGVSAAKKLNSHNFDLVLVDCENLPAAKLIFDVCRRGSGGHSPVAVAIVDGRAGLPTAFRLGAELILTKPVAKDQARNTVRTAVARVKKEEPARTLQTEASTNFEPIQSDPAKAAGESTPAVLTSYESTAELANPPLEARAMAAAVPAQAMPVHEPAPMAASSSTFASMSATAVLAPEIKASPVTRSESILTEPKLESTEGLSEDPVLAELEKAESEPMPALSAPVFSAYAETPKKEKRSRGWLIAILVLLVIGAGLYAAWMTQPAFRTIAQPQVERVLALAGMSHNSPSAATVQTPAKPPAQPVTVTASAPATENSQEDKPGAASATGATSSGAASAVSSASTPTTATASSTTTPSPATTSAAASPDKATSDNKLAAQSTGSTKTTGNGAAVSSSDETSSGDQSAIILSSKGAEKRLIHSVQPHYPAGVAAAEGTVVLKTQVDESGKVTDAKVVEGNAVLADSAVTAVKQWKYRPYLRDGKPVPFQTVVVIDFQRP